MPTSPSRSITRATRGAPARAFVALDHFADLAADVRTGFSEVIGSWKIVADRLPADSRIRRRLGGPQVLAVEEDAARR